MCSVLIAPPARISDHASRLLAASVQVLLLSEFFDNLAEPGIAAYRGHMSVVNRVYRFTLPLLQTM